jgi:hypothetical protein
MFLAHESQCAYKNRATLRNHIYDDFLVRRDKLRYDLDIKLFHCNHQYERLVNWTSILSNMMDYIMAMTNSTFYEFNNVIHNSLWRS